MKLLIGLCAFFTPIQGLFIAVGVAIILDTITGVLKVIKVKDLSFKSGGLGAMISKMLLYQATVLLLFPIDYYLLNDIIIGYFKTPYLFTKLCTMALILVELTSIKENIEEAMNVNIWKLVKNGLTRAKAIKQDISEITSRGGSFDDLDEYNKENN